ncbi:MFS transporter [Actinacidiphila acidipaludis]|uniref:MFS transporter n=1 Tax=Actinacidiphila acidipaludis TaxID=2873382 RepID=A0ABS7Q976_9ACTN|nr:MFS transporter [Streptomyces acidipaludis]MBY8879712.1 MFS transporter [Streptomyces acidipaludis]
MEIESQQTRAFPPSVERGRTVAPAGAGLSEAPDGRRRWIGLLVVCLGVMMALVDVSSTITALGAIQADLHAASSTLVWITSAYSLAVVSLVMTAGTLGDRVGRRLVFLLGAAVFVAGSLLAFFAGSPGSLIAAQAVMGAGGAALLPSSLAIVGATFTDPQERTAAISIWAACSGLGLAIGPMGAGALLEHFSWHAIFLINLGIGALALVLAPFFVSESRHPTRRLDVAGLILGTVATAAGTYAIIQGGASGYTKTPIVVAYVVLAVSVALFVRVELRHHDPMLDLRLFRNASFSAVMAVAATTMFGFVGISLLAVLYMERVGRFSPLSVGVRMLPLFATFILVSALASRLLRRFGFAATLSAGLVLMGSGALILLATGPSGGYASTWPGLLVAGLGSGLLTAPSTAAAVNSVPPLQAGMAAASVNMLRQLGSVLGPSVLGTLVTSHFAHNLHDRLVTAGVPGPQAGQVVAGASHGAAAGGLPPGLARVLGTAVPGAFTDAVHLGLVVGGIVLIVMAVPTALFVRQRTMAVR